MKRCVNCRKAFESDHWVCVHCGFEPGRIDRVLVFAPEFAQVNTEYPPDVFEELAAAESDNYWRKARNRLFTWAFRQYFPDAESFLEIGSGTGVILRAFRRTFPNTDLSGSEVYLQGLHAITGRVPGAKVYQLDARNLPFECEFNVIGAFDVIEHIEEDEQVLAEMHRATTKQGGIMVSVPQHPRLWSQRDVALRHKRRYTRKELVGKIQRAGFEPLRVTSFISFPFPLMALSALRNRHPREDYDPFAEFKTSPMTNDALSGILTIERQFIKLGLNYPFGGSLMVCARKA